jgi:hypothetical protein
MSSDLSRIGFDPHLDDLGVLWQQGRPTTDRDANEFVLQATRRIQAGMLDTVGPAVVPDATTPDAFKISAAGGSLEIERGRMYVDGLLVENHGAVPPNGTWSWDPQLAELFGSDPLGYATQPYDPNPPILPNTAGPHLVYLDVWQREVTHHMRDTLVGSPVGIDTRLVDPAIGVDTTSRLQTVWQVKVLADVGTADCQTPLESFPGWLPLNAHSAGRLTSDTATVPGQPDPCQVPPKAGYKGRDNQLYRIEVHEGGGIGNATFKWSRDNASVETRVTAIDASRTVLTVESIGRDDWLRFNEGDWVEVTDDWLELHGKPGEMRRIKMGGGVDEVARTITLDLALTAGLFPVDAQNLTEPARHTRVKRWDQKGKVFDAAGNEIQDLDAGGSDGTIDIPGGNLQVLIEHDIVASFELQPSNGIFRSGDWWVFAARAPDHSVEKLVDAPPRGIHHHYAKLGIWDPATNDVHDCRIPWPGECGGCCTVNVKPGGSIQTAIDSLPPEGGCVCLKTGVHPIEDTIRIERSNVVLRGESPGAIVRGPVVTMLLIGQGPGAVTDVTVEDIRFESSATTDSLNDAIVEARGCSRIRIDDCGIASTAEANGTRIGALHHEVAAARFHGNRVENVVVGVLVEYYDELVEVDGNHIEGRPITATANGLQGGTHGIVVRGALDGVCHVGGNFITSFATGIHLNERVNATRVYNNHITRVPVETQSTVPTGMPALRAYLESRIYAIDVRAEECIVRDNTIDLAAAAWGGILARGPRLHVIDNLLLAPFVKEGQGLVPLPAGIYCTAAPALGLGHASEIAGNRLVGSQTGLVLSRVRQATARDNRVEGNGWYGIVADDCIEACLVGNRVVGAMIALALAQGERNLVRSNDVREAGFGIVAFDERDLEISSTRVEGCFAYGALLTVLGPAAILGCRFANCCFSMNGAALAVIDSLQVVGAMLRIEDNEIVDTGISPNRQVVTPGAAWGVIARAQACEILGNHIGYTGLEPALPAAEHRAILLSGPLLIALAHGLFGQLSSALMVGNQLRGPGNTSLVETLSIPVAQSITFQFERVTFSDNVCDHWVQPNDNVVTVRIQAAKAIVLGNHVKVPPPGRSIAMGGVGSLMGNVVTGQILAGAGVVPQPIANFNVIAP